MEIILAKSAGFCFGVQKAVEKVEKSIKEYPKPIYTLGPIIHNQQVINRLKQQGVNSIDRIEDINSGVIVIRSHGVQPEIYRYAEDHSLKVIDATCPYVKNIQKKVERYYRDGYQIIIVGSKNHPEILGVNGWCDNTAIILEKEEDAHSISRYNKVCVVAQTTAIQEYFLKIVAIILEKSQEIVIFNTICNATSERQEETKSIAQQVDAMIVIGGYHSSNTQKLMEICKKYCEHSYHIETYKDLPLSELKKYSKIGITAGASTPDWIIKEVIVEMEKDLEMEKKQQEDSMVNIKVNDIVMGEVIAVNEEEVMVNIGYKSDGILPKNEYSIKKDVHLTEEVQPGDQIQVMILSLNDGEGNVLLSKKRVDERIAKERIKNAYENQEIQEGKIKKSIKGGFIVDLGFVDVFMPISQYHIKFIKDPEKAVGEEVRGFIIEYNPSKNRMIFSQRVLLEKEIQEKKDEVFQSLKEGDIITGTVKNIVKFGAFVDLGGIDGLIHISDLSWKRVNNPEEILSINDQVTAKVIEVDREKEKVRLSLKDLTEEPWAKFERTFNIEDKVSVKITKTTTFGAFAEIIPGVEGLIHKSQISFDNVDKVEDFLVPGQEVDVKIIDLDKEKRKIGLSITALQNKPVKKIEKNEMVYQEKDNLTLGDVFGNLFKNK